MPIKVPNNLPAVETLTAENVFVMTDARAMTQDIRPLQILILNLMPTKIDTETQLTRLLGNTPLQVELELLQTSTHKSQNTSEEHMIAFYKTFDQIKDNYYDGMIITGAPVELMEFEEVEYWEELCKIMEWSKSHVHSTFHICWGAQAGLYYHYGIKKRRLDRKLSGVYRHRLEYKNGMLFRGFDDEFYVPHSRNTTVSREDVEAVPELTIVSSSDEAGIYAIKSEDDRQIFIMGHSEYDGDTLLKEYLRDKNAGINPEFPCNYFPDDDDTREPVVRWRSCANLLYTNWLNYFVYQSTPYDIEQIKESGGMDILPENMDTVVCKFGGSSLADEKQFRKVKSIVQSNPHRKAVVVSAPGKRFDGDTKVTDLLLQCQTASEEEREKLFAQVEDRFVQMAQNLDIDIDLASEFSRIKEVIRDSENFPAEYLASRGEYLSAKLMAKYLGYEFLDSIDLIIFGDDGNYDEEETCRSMKQALAKVKRCVIPGFYGADRYGNIKVFSRGGSDLTGSIVAAAAGADLYENWTDVSGMLMADPKLIHNPVTVPVITYRELRELSYMGALVMHEDAVFPVMKKKIPIQIKNTNDPEAPGTLIVKSSEYYSSGSLISGISGRTGYIGLLLEKKGLNEDPQLRSRLLKVFQEQGVKVPNILPGIDSLTFIIKEEDYGHRLKAAITGEMGNIVVTPSEPLALIGIIGREVSSSAEIAVKVLNSLAGRMINIKLMDHSTENNNMLVGVAESDYRSAVEAIYNQLVRF